MATAAATMTTSPPAKGRKRKAADAEIDEKPRGRPRKNSKDESAAERRRTQIRLAQRAYRQRKETTIDELRQRVSELTTTVEMMNRALREFAQTATSRGLAPQTKTDLDALVQKLAPYVMTARNPSKFPHADNAAMPNISAVTVDPLGGGYNDAATSGEEDPHIDIGMGYSLMLDDNQGAKGQAQDTYQTAQMNPAFGPEVFPNLRADAQSHQHSHTTGSVQQKTPEMLTEEQQLESQLQQISQPFLNTSHYESALVPRSLSISPVQSYSYFEKSFSRRLQRRCIETGWELLNNPTIAPSTYNRVFRLTSLLGRPHSALLHAFSVALGRTINDTLDSAASPFSNVGGAGLHYPDNKAGCRRAPTQSRNSAALDTIASTIPGFEGEWLDPQDVQGYLHERGIRVDGAASFVHARLPLSYLTTPSHLIGAEAYISSLSPGTHALEEAEIFHRQFLDRNTGADPIQPGMASALAPSRAGNLDLNTMGLWNPDLGNLDLGSLTDILDSPALNFFTIPGTASYEAARPGPGPGRQNPYSSAEGRVVDLAAAAEASSGSSGSDHTSSGSEKARSASSVSSVESVRGKETGGRQDRRTEMEGGGVLNVTLDVARLMKGLIMGSVCLGRSPGFRRELVDAAVRGSVVMSF
ncbi:hypothetical protein CAC42_952 [Sphaceloma murrayae]|uniref:BZIP domain-containing protein n=1 Tax=Sphaceloma murrayae TaxID=2082308 RepID=A0A2K1R333_9PEZI|nr:hypothetical protein CAC42_952 [Sphaceloma murrayae]